MKPMLLDEPLQAEQIDEEDEQRLLGITGGRAILGPYLRFSP